MTQNVQKAIQAILTAFNRQQGAQTVIGGLPVVAVSRDYGAGGDEIARLLAERLGVEVYDSLILDKIAERLHAEPESLKVLDESISRARDMWLYRMWTGLDVSPGTYKRHLVDVIFSLARVGGVIMGRGAHVVLSTSKALRVRITGSLDVCAERVAAREEISLEEAKARVQEINHARGKFVWDMFGVRHNDPSMFDIVINTDRLGDTDYVLETIINAMKAVVVEPEDEEQVPPR